MPINPSFFSRTAAGDDAFAVCEAFHLVPEPSIMFGMPPNLQHMWGPAREINWNLLDVGGADAMSSTFSRAGNVITITTPIAHNIIGGQSITVATSADMTALPLGVYQCLTASGTTITVTSPQSGVIAGPISTIIGCLPHATRGFVCRQAATANSFLTCGACSTLMCLPPNGGALIFDTAGSDANKQIIAGITMVLPGSGLQQPAHGFTVDSLCQVYLSGNSVAPITQVAPTLGYRVALVRWSDTLFQWFRQADSSSPRMVPIFSMNLPDASGLNLYPSVQMFSRGSGAKGWISTISPAYE